MTGRPAILRAGLRQRFAARTPRERLLLMLLAIVGTAALAYLLVWQPVQSRRAALLTQIARVDRGIAALGVLGTGGAVPLRAAADPRPLNVVVTDSAALFGLPIQRIEPDAAALRLTLGETPFESVMLWLEALSRDHGLTVREIEITRRPAPGAVTATLTMERPPR